MSIEKKKSNIYYTAFIQMKDAHLHVLRITPPKHTYTDVPQLRMKLRPDKAIVNLSTLPTIIAGLSP